MLAADVIPALRFVLWIVEKQYYRSGGNVALYDASMAIRAAIVRIQRGE